MKSFFRCTAFVLLVICAGVELIAQEYSTSIVGTDFDIITEQDRSCFLALDYTGIQRVEMPDKTNDGNLFQAAHLFEAGYSDNTSINIAIDSSIQTEKSARAEALQYATRLGKLPTALRSGVERLVVHAGNEKTTAFSDEGLIVMYAGNAQKRIKTNDLEETLFHESVHAAWDKKYAKSLEWRRVQAADGTFATLYAKRKPELEDLAESALLAYAVIHQPDRLPREDCDHIKSKIPARIQFVERLVPFDRPIFFDVNETKEEP